MSLINLGGADFMVAEEGTADLAFSIVSEDEVAEIGQNPDVVRVEGILFHTAGRLQPVLLHGREGCDSLTDSPPHLIEGSLWGETATNEIILGKRAARDGGYSVGIRW